MKYQLTGFDLDGIYKRHGQASTLKIAKEMKKSARNRGITLTISNTKTNQIYK